MKLVRDTLRIAVGFVAIASMSQSYAAESAEAFFSGVCSVCHGAGGKGDGPAAAGLHPKPADFTDCKVMAREADETLFKIIKGGGQSVGRSTVMPSWKDSLSDEEIRSLVKYIRGLCKK